MKKHLPLFIVSLLLFLPDSDLLAQFRRPAVAKKAMVACADQHATHVALEVLKRGGNAVDAMTAAGFTLAVTYPQAGNIGGGGFMLIREQNGSISALDYREKAPLAADEEMYLDKAGDVIEDASTVGYRASGVPGTVAGLFKAHARFGSLPWEDLLQYAIDFASEGFRLNRYIAHSLASKEYIFKKFDATAGIFLNTGAPFSEGDTLVQADLAGTLKRIQEKGRDGFYSGPVAQSIQDVMLKNGGLITKEDLDDYKAEWRDPIHFSYRQFEVYSMPPPSSGGIVLAEILNSLEHTRPASYGFNSSALIHLLVEIEKKAYADRAEYLGDPDFYDVPQKRLISKEYAKEIIRMINPFYARSGESVRQLYNESDQTTHISIVDEQGMAVANTYTLNGSFGSGVVIDGTGMLMNNEMDDFSIKPGHANMYGLVGGVANAIKPSKRMLSSMTPTIITKNDSLYLVVGSPGGSKIMTTVAQVISNVIDHKLNIRDAVEAPRFHCQWSPHFVYLEKFGFSWDVINKLQQKGHSIEYIKSMGDVHALLWDNSRKEWTGWSDPRGNGLCQGY